jgi:hypothetical protein
MSREFLPVDMPYAIIEPMDADNRERGKYFVDFPLNVILPRWFFALTEMGIATYFLFKFGFRWGIIFLIYGFVAIFVLLPLTRCNRCFYYGRNCNFGLGKWAALFFPESSEKIYSSAYGYSILFWPLRLIPIMLGLVSIVGVIRNSFYVPSGEMGDIAGAFISGLEVIPHGLFVFYLLIIYLHRKYYRSRSCTRCYHKLDCPVYDKSALLETKAGNNSVTAIR